MGRGTKEREGEGEVVAHPTGVWAVCAFRSFLSVGGRLSLSVYLPICVSLWIRRCRVSQSFCQREVQEKFVQSGVDLSLPVGEEDRSDAIVFGRI